MPVLEVVEFTNGIEHTPAGFFRDILSVVEHARNCRQRYSGTPGDFTHRVGHILVLAPESRVSGFPDILPQLATGLLGKPITTLWERPRGKATRLDKANPLGYCRR